MNLLSSWKVLVTATSFGHYGPQMKEELASSVKEVIYNTLGRPLTEDELIEIIPEVDGCIAGLDEFSPSVFKVAKKLRVVSRYGVGYDAIDLNAAQAHNVIITNTPGANSSSVAELTIGLILSLLRSIPVANAKTKAGEWPRLYGGCLTGKTVGLLGLGAIGQQVVIKLRGFDCPVIAYDPVQFLAFSEEYGVESCSMDNVVHNSDILSLHLPLNENTHNLVDYNLLMNMKPGAYLINTARGGLIDEQALDEALRNKHLGGAALDVYSNQPPGSDNPLLKHDNLIATPHLSAHTDDAANKMGQLAMNDCFAVLRGEEPVYRVV